MNDRASFERLALVHMDSAYNLAFWLLRDRADAEDAVQDAMVRAFRAYHQLEGTHIRPWLLTIVRNVCYRRLQERRRAANVISLDEAVGGAASTSELVSSQLSPEQEAMATSDRTVLERVLAALPPAFREVVILRELEELSYKEIAVVIGAPVGTVMSRLARARAELRAQLTRLMEQDDGNAM